MGFPLREASEARRIYAAFARLPELLKRVRNIERCLEREAGQGIYGGPHQGEPPSAEETGRD